MHAALNPLTRRSRWKRHPVAPGDVRRRSFSQPVGNALQQENPIPPPAHAVRTTSDTASVYCIASNTNPFLAQDWCHLATTAQGAGRYGEARTAYREARRLAPHDIDIVLNLAHMEMECGRHQHAYDLLQIVIRKRPLLAVARIHAARSCHELGRNKRARSLISGWLHWQLDNDMSAELGALLIQLDSIRDGLSILDGLADVSQVNPRAVVYAVTSLEQANCLDKARQWAILLPSPARAHSPVVREEILAWYARLAWRDGDLATARKLLGFLDMPPTPGVCRSAKPYWLMAEVCFQQSDYEAAEIALRNARATLVKAADIACLRGNCHLRETIRAHRILTSKHLPEGSHSTHAECVAGWKVNALAVEVRRPP